CYNPLDHEWKVLGPVSRHRSGVGVASLNGSIYAVGGHDGVVCLNSVDRVGAYAILIFLSIPVERYNPTEDKWSPCPPLRICRENLGCATFQGKIYAVGGRDDLTELCSAERFDPLTNEWSAVPPMKSKRSKVSLVVANGNLLAIGGYDGIVHVATVEAFDWEMNKWRRFGSMQTRHPGGGVTAIKTAPYDPDFSDSPWSR
ncbi:hypothetical protein JD844_004874, partial [Phrynosoma platyrhinos]